MHACQLLFLFLLLTGCSKQAELTGHWHLNHGAEYSYISTVDFISDTLFIYNQRLPRWEGPSGYLDQKAQTLYWGGECMMGDWSYESLSADEIKISDRRSGEYVGILTRNTSCQPLDDLFLDTPFDIQLPTFAGFNIDIGPPSLISEILTGPLKPDYQHIYSGKFQVALGDKIIEPDYETDLALFDEQHRVKLPETKHHLIKTLIYLDKDTPLSTLKPVLEHYAQVGRIDIYFAGISGSGDSSQLVYRQMNACDLLEEIPASSR